MAWQLKMRPGQVLPNTGNDDSMATLLRTIEFAAHKHSKQTRKDAAKSPYINHPIGVASLIANLGGVSDLATLQAAILHDTLEDTETTVGELQREFGDVVAMLVFQVTDDKRLSVVERKKAQVMHTHAAPRMPTGSRLVKLADKLYNLRDILTNPPDWSVERVRGYFVWSAAVIHGLRGTSAPLENALDDVLRLGFKMTEQDASLTVDAMPATFAADKEVALQAYYNLMQNCTNPPIVH